MDVAATRNREVFEGHQIQMRLVIGLFCESL
jgi:hypothetical protein